MVAVRARVERGRIIVDEPTDLPDGTRLELRDLVVVDDDTDIEPEERARLDAALSEAFESVKAGRVTEGDEVFRRLLR